MAACTTAADEFQPTTGNKRKSACNFVTNGQVAAFIHLLLLIFCTKFTNVIFMALKVASFPVGPFELTGP